MSLSWGWSSCLPSGIHLILICLYCVLRLCHSFKGCALPLPSCFRTIIPSAPFQVYFGDYCFLKLSRPPRWLSGKESTCQCRRRRRHWFDSWVGTIPWRKKWQPTPVSLPGKSHGQGSLVGYKPWGCKESDMIELLRSKLSKFNTDSAQSDPTRHKNTILFPLHIKQCLQIPILFTFPAPNSEVIFDV